MDEKKQKEFYKTTFNTVAKGYEHNSMRFFSNTANRIPSYLNLSGDEYILDVATGTGLVAFSLAEMLPQGKVTGIDLSQGMLDVARKKQRRLDIGNVIFQEMDMQSLDFADKYFDAAVASFSIFFVEAMQEQLVHISKKVKIDGEVIITTFFKDSFSPLVILLFDRLKAYGVEIPPLAGERVNTQEQCIELFQNAGLKDVKCEKVDFGYYLDGFDMWWYIVFNAGLRGFVSQLSDGDLEKFKAEHLSEVDELMTREGIWLEMNILFTVGKR